MSIGQRLEQWWKEHKREFFIGRKYMSVKQKIKFWWQRHTRGWSDDECWNLDYQFILWVNSRFKQYKKDASEIVDLNYHKFKYKGKTYPLSYLIDKVIMLSNTLIDEKQYFDLVHSDNDKIQKTINEIFDIFKLIFGAMWW